MIAVGGALRRLMLSLRREKQLKVLRKISFLLGWEGYIGYTLLHTDADGKVNDFTIACCFMLLSLGDDIIFKIFF